MAIVQTECEAYNLVANGAEGVRQVSCECLVQEDIRVAEIAYYRLLAAAALENGVSPSAALEALRSFGQTLSGNPPPEPPPPPEEP